MQIQFITGVSCVNYGARVVVLEWRGVNRGGVLAPPPKKSDGATDAIWNSLLCFRVIINCGICKLLNSGMAITDSQ